MPEICKNGTERQIHKLWKCINYTNLDSLEEQRHILCLKFSKNGIKHNNLNDLFPENDKTHKMKTRAVEKYKVQQDLVLSVKLQLKYNLKF